jgi:predicted pyridoxine 5'-phosphate oxidase superfamily flavin-nucleotide-binding protein
MKTFILATLMAVLATAQEDGPEGEFEYYDEYNRFSG